MRACSRPKWPVPMTAVFSFSVIAGLTGQSARCREPRASGSPFGETRPREFRGTVPSSGGSVIQVQRIEGVIFSFCDQLFQGILGVQETKWLAVNSGDGLRAALQTAGTVAEQQVEFLLDPFHPPPGRDDEADGPRNRGNRAMQNAPVNCGFIHMPATDSGGGKKFPAQAFALCGFSALSASSLFTILCAANGRASLCAFARMAAKRAGSSSKWSIL